MSIEKTIEKLEKIAYHNVPVKNLKQLVNPFQCWQELKKPITKKEVMDCLKQGNEALTKTPLALELAFSGKPLDFEKMRENHIRKIAYFVKNKPEKAIYLDVGVPSMGCHVNHIVDDGNHRLAGAILRNDETIKCNIAGCLEHIKTLGLWYPNDAYMELDNLYRIQAEERNKNSKLKM